MCNQNSNGGLPAFRGFEYQILVSVWLALKYIFQENYTEKIYIEPPCNEDIELPIENKDRASLGIHISKIRIQIKYRSNPVWTSSAFRELINTSPTRNPNRQAPRDRALSFLKTDEGCYYLLITNSGTSSGMQDFVINELGERSTFTGRIAEVDDQSILSRIGILHQKTEEFLLTEIHNILQNHCHISYDDLEACQEQLKWKIKEILIGTASAELNRDALIEIFRCFDESAFSRSDFIVFPHNIKDIEAKLTCQYGIIISGEPGTGKTTVANYLKKKYSSSLEPCKIITDWRMIEEKINAPGRHVFFLSDPWGGYKLSSESDLITSQLHIYLPKAKEGKYFIITTRHGVFISAVQNRSGFDKYKSILSNSDYKKEEREKIFDHTIETGRFHGKVKSEMGKYKGEALNIDNPYSLVCFVNILARKIDNAISASSNAEERKVNLGKIYRERNDLIKAAGMEAVGSILRQELEEKENRESSHRYIVPSIAIWGIFRVYEHISKEMLRQITLPFPLLRTYEYLVGAHWLIARDDGYVAHPTVLEALEQFSESHEDEFRETLSSLLAYWFNNKRYEIVLKFLQRDSQWKKLLAEDVSHDFSRFLLDEYLNSSAYDSRGKLNVLATLGSEALPEVKIARSLLNYKPKNQRFIHGYIWVMPDLSDTEKENFVSSPNAVSILKHFIEGLALGDDSRNKYCANSLLNYFDLWGREHFLKAFKDTLEKSLAYCDGDIAFLIICCHELQILNIEDILDKCIRERISMVKSFEEETWEEGEFDAVDEMRFSEPPDSFFHLEEAINKLLALARDKYGWQWILKSQHLKFLIPGWADCGHDFDDTEIAVFLQAAIETNNLDYRLKPFRFKRFNSGSLLMLNEALSLARDFPEIEIPYLIRQMEDDDIFAKMKNRLKTADDLGCFVLGMILMANKACFSEKSALKEKFIEECLPDTLASLAKKVIGLPKDQSKYKIEDVEYNFLLSFCNQCENSISEMVLEYIRNAENYDYGRTKNVIQKFSNSSFPKVRRLAYSLSEDILLLKKGLTDTDWKCRKAALEKLAQYTADDEHESIYCFANDKCCYIREAVINILVKYKWTDGLETLKHLVRDDRDYCEYQHNAEEPECRVARKAAQLLYEFSPSEAKQICSIIIQQEEKKEGDLKDFGVLEELIGEPSSNFLQNNNR